MQDVSRLEYIQRAEQAQERFSDNAAQAQAQFSQDAIAAQAAFTCNAQQAQLTFTAAAGRAQADFSCNARKALADFDRLSICELDDGLICTEELQWRERSELVQSRADSSDAELSFGFWADTASSDKVCPGDALGQRRAYSGMPGGDLA